MLCDQSGHDLQSTSYFSRLTNIQNASCQHPLTVLSFRSGTPFDRHVPCGRGRIERLPLDHPGSHRWGLLHDARDHEQNMRTRENVEKHGEPISIPMKTRDILLFHNLTFHSSRENRTQRARWNVDIRFMANPACRILSDAEREADKFLAEKMRRSKKPSLVVQGKGAGVSWEEWRKRYPGRLQTLGD